MKRSIILVIFGLLMAVAHADNDALHMHPSIAPNKPVKSPSCIIKISNDSKDDIIVYGTFDDGTPLRPFVVYAYEAPHYILLEYNGFCHALMEVGVDTTSGLHLYRENTWVNSRIRILSGWFKPYIVLERG